MRDSEDVTTIELKVADASVGSLRMRSRERAPDAAVLRLVSTLIASEMERTRAPERASEEAATGFQREALRGGIPDRDDLVARGRELGTDLAAGGTVIVVRAHPRNPTEDDWRRQAARVESPRGPIGRGGSDRVAHRRRPRRDRRARSRRRRRVGQARVLLDPARDRVGPARVRIRDRPQPSRRRPAPPRARGERSAARDQRRRRRRRAHRAGVRRDRDLPAAAAAHERPGRAAGGSTTTRSARSSPTTSSTRPTCSARCRRSSSATRTSTRPPRDCSPIGTRSVTGSSACES